MWRPVINCSFDASGAWQAATQGHVVVIVDIIDMSTTLEAALEAGARKVYGASPDGTIVPIEVKPEVIGWQAGKEALLHNSSVLVVAEPRWDDREARIKSCAPVLRGLERAGIKDYFLLPNLGASTVKLADFQDAIVVAVTNSGGVAFDAAFQAGGTVLTATVARTLGKKGLEPAKEGVKRAIDQARSLHKHITFVAASGNSLEDTLASQYLAQMALSLTRHLY
ncbi:MAG TPA: 2-phosphosulfolactate phosphatase [Clostridia bacterium]|nr:2-phosphosulfolactate phosphatase [Clostridia bacterium]